MTDNPVKILVVEDEMIIGAKISMFLTELGYEVTAVLPRAEDALLQLQDNAPDLALLDIHLKGSMNGIALAQILHKDHHIPVIFLTANTDDATFQQAKAAKPFAFLAKPFRKTDLQRALELAISLMAVPAPPGQMPPEAVEDKLYVLPDRIFVNYKEKMVKIRFDAIHYVEAERNYCRIVTTGKEYLLSMPMKSLEDKLPPAMFQRIHRSYIINLAFVEEVMENGVLVGTKHLPVSQSLRAAFLKRLMKV